jgi:RNA polymerase sigma-70 factor (ECF subfamily)
MSEPDRPGRWSGVGISTVVGERRLLGAVAERLLGSARDAEDVVQETYARWYAMPEDLQDEVGWPTAWLTSVASRLCFERLNGARVSPPLLAESRHPGERAPRGGPMTPRVPAYRYDRIVQAFKMACEGTDGVGELTVLLAPDVTVITDSGGRVRAPLQPITGADQVARFVVGLFGGQDDVTLVEASINGGPGLVVRVGGTTAAVVMLRTCDDRIQDVWIVMNPDKLRAWQGHEDPPPDTTRTR